MQPPQLSPHALRALLPPLARGDVPLPIGLLHRWASEGKVPRRTLGWQRALLLAAYLHRVSSALLTDLGMDQDGAVFPEIEPWRWAPEPFEAKMLAGRLEWTGGGLVALRPLPATRQMLNAVPRPFAKSLIQWAPPYVVQADRDGMSRVLGNHWVALQARMLIPDTRIAVRRSAVASAMRVSLPAVAQGLVTLLRPLYDAQREEIARFAIGEDLARLLTGYSRAQYFRVKAEASDG